MSVENQMATFVKAWKRNRRLNWLTALGAGLSFSALAARDGVVIVPRGSDVTYDPATVDSLASPGFTILALSVLALGIVLKILARVQMRRAAAAMGTTVKEIERMARR